jgi:hypothetical protein
MRRQFLPWAMVVSTESFAQFYSGRRPLNSMGWGRCCGWDLRITALPTLKPTEYNLVVREDISMLFWLHANDTRLNMSFSGIMSSKSLVRLASRPVAPPTMSNCGPKVDRNASPI